ncbi:MAG: hypothetical protein WC457_02225 [Patescibacteria group bacterium]
MEIHDRFSENPDGIDVVGCNSYSDYQELAEKLDKEGYVFAHNMLKSDAKQWFDNSGIKKDNDVVFTSAFSRPNEIKLYGEPVKGYVGIWCRQGK